MCWFSWTTCVKSLSATQPLLGVTTGPPDVHLNVVGSSQVLPSPAPPPEGEPADEEPPVPPVAAPLVAGAPPIVDPPCAPVTPPLGEAPPLAGVPPLPRVPPVAGVPPV